MGRHSASYFAAQQAVPGGPTVVGAARYVGRVGALALALGVGAAVAGGTGLAHAEGTDDNDVSGGASAQSSRDTAADTTTTDAGPAGSPATKTPGGGAHTPTSVDKPPTTGRRTAAEPDSLSGLIARIPKQIDAMLGAGERPRPHVSAPATTEDEDDARDENPPVDRPTVTDRPNTTDKTEVDATVDRTATATDDVSTGARGSAKPLSAARSTTPDTTRQSRLTTAAVATVTPQSATELAAPARAAVTQAPPALANPIATVVTGFLNALGFTPTASTGQSPIGPIQLVLGALHLISREIERIFAYQPPSTTSFTSAEAIANANPAIAPGAPSPGDEATTPYGDVGKWMLQPDGQISDYGGLPFEGRTVLEPVNVIIVDSTSKTPAEAAFRLNSAMWWAGFPAQPIHSTGFQGEIDDVIYGQQPTALLSGYSNNFFLVDNDHGRIFGPDPVETSTGYVWSGAFSRETLVFPNFIPAHAYVSSDVARAALATSLIFSGQATFVSMTPLDNAYDTDTTTTGDHDGYAVVLRLK